jgi:hypothetical protein
MPIKKSLRIHTGSIPPSTDVGATLRRVSSGDHTIETITSEIQRIVTERQDLRGNGAPPEALEENRRLLTHAQSLFSHLLIQHHLPQPAAA